jgi:hypothetical protein
MPRRTCTHNFKRSIGALAAGTLITLLLFHAFPPAGTAASRNDLNIKTYKNRRLVLQMQAASLHDHFQGCPSVPFF